MDRDKTEKPTAALGTRPNGRFAPPLLITTLSQRKKLFAPGATDENAPLAIPGNANRNGAPLARPASSSSTSDAKVASVPSSATKIPRPTAQDSSSRQRRPFSLSDAFRAAEREEEEAAGQTSPSPAPRSWRVRRETSERKQHNATGRGSIRLAMDTKGSPRLGRDETNSSVESFGAASQLINTSGDDFDRRLRRHARETSEPDTSGDLEKDIFSKTTLGTKIAETGRDLVRKASNNSLKSNSPSRSLRSWGSKLSRGVSGRKGDKSNELVEGEQAERDVAASSIEEDRSPVAKPATIPAGSQSSNKSFAWQADTDFTAGDLQVSTSPPVRLGWTNAKIDEIRALKPEVNRHSSESPKPRLRNTRIDEIRALEAEAALRFPDELASQDDDTVDISELPRPTRPMSRTNTKIDEIRAREIESLSKRALATARLDEIRERNAEFRSRSASPEVSRMPSREPLRASPPSGGDAPTKQLQDGPLPGTGSPSAPDDSQELLRRLARATSSSPAPARARVRDSPQDNLGESSKTKKSDTFKGDIKPTVGFAGLRREPSLESNLSSQSRRAHSDSDPTDRIEGEMKLFAPREDYSEKGSLRAPSPDLGEDDKEGDVVEDTPRPLKPDPTSQPTPRVTGAYVDTPATVKVVAMSHDVPISEVVKSNTTPLSQPVDTEAPKVGQGEGQGSSSLKVPVSAMLRGRRTKYAPRNTKHTASASGERIPGRALSISAHRRARSLPRARSPLVNSVKPPTVRDDLLAIHRNNQVEDSTLDDFEDLLGSQENILAESRGQFTTEMVKIEDDVKVNLLRELATYDRMNKSLKTGLLGIRTAKQGIERLEDKVAHADTTFPLKPAQIDPQPTCTSCLGRSSGSMVAYIHVPTPRLWRREPTFRLTFIGLATVLLSIWYLAESAMCSIYCKPVSCHPGQPCQWSPEDPSWGISIPVKFDQWTTGGLGREFITQITPDIADWVADVWDAATGTDLLTVDTRIYNWRQKQQHRRRLIKKGLVKGFVEMAEDRPKYTAWRAARLAQERADSAREMGYETEDESMTADEKVRW